jgi:hypothetical protein
MSRWWEHPGVLRRRPHGEHRNGDRWSPYAYIRPT